MPNLLARTLSGLALLLVLVAAPASPRASMWLAPGEPLLQDHLESLVAPALPPGELLELVFSQPALPLVNPAASEAFLQLLELRYEPRTERFSGAFLVRLESGEERVLGLAGRAQAMVEIMVPVRTIAAGERLQPSLLEPVVVAERLLKSKSRSENPPLPTVPYQGRPRFWTHAPRNTAKATEAPIQIGPPTANCRGADRRLAKRIAHTTLQAATAARVAHVPVAVWRW